MRAPITSVKHYVQISLETVAAGAIKSNTLVHARATADVTDADEVHEGAIVKAVYVEMWIRAGSTSPGSVLVSLYKKPGIGTAMTFADHIALFDYDNKKNVLYHTQGLMNDQDADAIPFVRGWFKIPKGKQRFGLNDSLILATSAQGAIDVIECGFATYKEYT